MTLPSDYVYNHFPSMEAAYEALKKIVTELDTATDDLYSDVKTELAGAWEGDVERLFDEKRAQWNEIEKAMGLQLFKAAEVVSIAKGNYEMAEKKNINIWMD
ncbi:WXG100 family type VII secretion target [Nonomuraea sp. NPDC002799]